jgi:hypothetical protein
MVRKNSTEVTLDFILSITYVKLEIQTWANAADTAAFFLSIEKAKRVAEIAESAGIGGKQGFGERG